MLAIRLMAGNRISQTKGPKAAAHFMRNLVKRAAVCFFGTTLWLCAAPLCSAQTLTPVWVELGPDGAAIARVVVNSEIDCPTIQIDGTSQPMTLRRPMPPGFRPACELALPATAQVASVNGRPLALPRRDPSRVVAFGDTGCRIKAASVQDCDDPAKWPFEQIATEAAAEKAQLMIHVGDYLYREDQCPAAQADKCGDSPSGYGWESWNADFFKPAAKLLASVPWAFSRGNHEDCSRAWRGWFYYLDPRPWNGMCETYSAPYLIKLGAFELVMLDSAAVNELAADPDQITEYTSQLLSLNPKNAWLVDHHPFWGFSPTIGDFPPIPISAPLEEAWNHANPKGYSLILSGHIHLFEVVDVSEGRPEQLVLGDGGTQMAAAIQRIVRGVNVRGAVTAGAETEHEFGYTVFTKTPAGWNFTLKNISGEPLISCQLPGSASSCRSHPP